MKAKTIEKVVLTDCNISLDEFIAVARYNAELVFSDMFKSTVDKGRALIDKFLEENRKIYGVTTGFGENVRYTISTDDAIELQKRIVRSHSVAVGRPLSEEQTRAIMLQMILNSGKGQSGIQLATLEVIREYLNKDLYPFAPGEGSVGYLAVEGHFVMAFIGEGFVFDQGEKVPAIDVMKRNGIIPVTLKCKEGLSLLNGTITVTALAMLAQYDAEVTMKNVDVAGALCYEALRGTTKALDHRIHEIKNHREAASSADILRRLLKGSEISEKYRDAKVQDCYILRAMPQIHGAGHRLVNESHDVMMEEMHGVSDNPEVFPLDANGNETSFSDEPADGVALMCGNFDGSYVGTHADMLSMAAAMVGNEVERSIDRMVNRNLNDGLPAFLVKNPGLNNGFMIPQYTAAGLESEMRILAHPSSIDTVSTCANQEDPVSMAYFASKKAGECMRKLQYMVGIEYYVALQAIDFLNPLKESPVLTKVHDFVRKEISFVDEDRYLYPDIEQFKEWVFEGVLTDIVEEEVGEMTF